MNSALAPEVRGDVHAFHSARTYPALTSHIATCQKMHIVFLEICAFSQQFPDLQKVAAIGPQRSCVRGDHCSACRACEAADEVTPLHAGGRVLALHIRL